MYILAIVYIHNLYHTMKFSLHKQAADNETTEIWAVPSTILQSQSEVRYTNYRCRWC